MTYAEIARTMYVSPVLQSWEQRKRVGDWIVGSNISQQARVFLNGATHGFKEAGVVDHLAAITAYTFHAQAGEYTQ